VALVSQQAFITNDTIQRNVTFGLPFDRDRFNEAIKLSELKTDLVGFPDGSLTEIGERGVNLSGGQRMRVSIARAIYSKADVVVMDDPLAAVDAHVGRNIFENTVVGHFRARKLAVLLVTNGFGYLNDSRVDKILVLGGGEGNRGKIVERGNYKDLVKADGEFVKLMGEDAENAAMKEKGKKEGGGGGGVKESESIGVRPSSLVDAGDDVKWEAPKKLVSVEERARGDVPLSTYASYFFTGDQTWYFFLRSVFIFLLFFSVESFISVQDYWLGLWGQVDPNNDGEMTRYSNIYFVIFGGIFFLTSLRSVLFSYFAVQSSVFSHDNAISNVVRCPTWWFDTTPVGRILNRFAQDLSDVDERLPQVTQFALITCSRVVIVVVLACIPVPYMTFCMVPVIYIFARTREYFRRSSRETQRLLSITSSPVFQQLEQTLLGLPVIRAFGQQDR